MMNFNIMKTKPRSNQYRRFAAAALFACAVMAPVSMLAQATRPADASAPAKTPDEEVVVLEEFNIVETARADEWVSTQAMSGTRTSENIINLPYQIQVITSEFMKDFDMVSTVEQLSTVSGFVGEADQADPAIGSSAGLTGASSRLRGFTTIILRDGFKYAQPPQLSNTQQTEVIKGPISALYGAAQPGGLINYVSKRPGARPSYEAWLTLGNYGRWNPGVTINTPVYKKKIYFLGSYERMVRKSDIRYIKADTTTAYASLLFKPFKGTNLTVSYETQHLEGVRQAGAPNVYINNTLADGSTDPRNWDTKSGSIVGIYWPWVEYGLNISGPNESYNRDYDRLHVQVEQVFSRNWKFRGGFQWQHKTFDQNYYNNGDYSENFGVMRDFVPQVRFQDYKYPWAFQGDVLGNFRTGKIRHALLFTVDGMRLEYISDNWRLPSSLTVPSSVRYQNPWYPDWSSDWFSYDDIRSKDRAGNRSRLSSCSYQNITMLAWSVGERMFLFNERLVIMGSLRYDDTSYSYQTVTGTAPLKDEPGFPGYVKGDPRKYTYSVGTNWKVLADDALVIFANYSTSFNTIIQYDEGTGELMPNETGEGFEGGIKMVSPSRKIAGVFSYFHIEKQNIPQSNPDYRIGDGSPEYLGTGIERIQGVDFDFSWMVTRHFTIKGAAAYLDPIVVFSTDKRLIGTRKTSVSTKTVSVSAKYQFPGVLKGFSIGASMRYRSGWVRANYRPASPTDAERLYEWIGGVTLWNGFIRYEWKSGKLRQSLSLNSSNIFDKIHTGNGSTRSLGCQVNLTYRVTYK